MFKSFDDLPAKVREILPVKAQKIYFAAYNGSFKSTKGDDKDDDGQGHAIAWAAVKKKYHKDEKSGKWVEGAAKVTKESAQAFIAGLATGNYGEGHVIAEAYQSSVAENMQVVLSEEEAQELQSQIATLQEKLDTVKANTVVIKENDEQVALKEWQPPV